MTGCITRPNRGFALVVSLSLMVLLVVIALGLLSLSTISLRTSTRGQALAEAQANARMAMMIAIGELQKSLGTDRRISAPSGILDSNPQTDIPDDVAHSHLTGVWNARDGSTETLDKYNASPPDYGRDKPNFLRWLVSNANSGVLGDLNFAQTGSMVDPVTLVKIPTGGVSAGRVPVTGGKYAWWIGDENCKARVDTRDLLARQASPSTADLLAAYATSSSYGMQALPGYEAFPANTADSDKLISRSEMDLVPPSGTNPADRFHDLTPYSESVLADVTTGTLRKDLSIYLERQDINWLADWKNSSWAAGPLGPNGKIALSPLSEYDVLAWKTLHHYYNMQRQVTYAAGGRPTVMAVDYPANSSPQSDSQRINNPLWNNGVSMFSPVVVRMQYLLSYGIESSGTGNDLYFYSYPVATLWNPYNVDMVIKGLNIFIHNLPLEHFIYKNQSPTEFARYRWLFNNGGGMMMRFGVPFGTPATSFTLKAGEQKIFNYVTGSSTANFIPHNMAVADSKYAWSMVHAGARRLVASNVGLPTDRIGIKTRAGTYATNGPTYADFQSSFEVRTDSAGHLPDAVPQGLWDQGFSSIYAWRFEAGSPSSNELSENNLPSKTVAELTNAPSPFCMLEVRMKPLDEVQTPNKTWLNCIPSLPYAGNTSSTVNGGDPVSQFYSHPYSVSFTQKTTVLGLFQTIPYMGSSYDPGSGQSVVADREVPQVPLTSLAQLQNLPLISMDTMLWGVPFQQNHASGNSYASPGVPSDKIKTGGVPIFLTGWANSYSGYVDGTKTPTASWTTGVQNIDRSYCANHLLWDEYFFSSMAPQMGSFYQRFGQTRSHKAVVDEFLSAAKPLPNAAYTPYLGGTTAQKVSDALIDSSGKVTTDGHLKSAAHLMASGGFNINSTSVSAWTVLLASSHLKRPVIMDTTGSGNPSASPKGNFVVSRFTMPIGGSAGTSEDMRWRGYRELTTTEISQLAKAIVRQVKKRGPFRSLGEFINRRLSPANDETALYGALQAALEDPLVDINKDYRSRAISAADIANTNYAFKQSALGSRFQGTPAYISQADILQPIAPIINARSDTFLIRGYGEALSPDGKTVLATARCEVVVQRYPDYVNPVDKAETPMTSPSLNPVNLAFGRRFHIKSFRWLTPQEV